VLIRLIYISTARSELSAAELEGVLRASRRNNAAVGVTGLLVVGGRRFLQALEGPADAVAQTYDRIKADGRHFAAVTLDNRPIAERSFPDWAMGEADRADRRSHHARVFCGVRQEARRLKHSMPAA
jgi:hypothetical protein